MTHLTRRVIGLCMYGLLVANVVAVLNIVNFPEYEIGISDVIGTYVIMYWMISLLFVFYSMIDNARVVPIQNIVLVFTVTLFLFLGFFGIPSPISEAMRISVQFGNIATITFWIWNIVFVLDIFQAFASTNPHFE